MKRPAMRPVMAAMLLTVASAAMPALAQTAASASSTADELRLRKLEAEVRALQRQVFPGGDGKYFAPQVQSGTPAATTTGTPATTPVADLLSRMDSVEAQIARLTAQSEVNTNKLAQLEARIAALSAAGAAPAASAGATAATTLAPASSGTTAATPAPATATTPASATPRAATTPPRPATAAAPSAQRLAAVRAIEKPKTDDAGDDEYSYGYRLWDAKFYPEAQQQLKLFLDKYPRHARVSYARNLLGRAFLDEGKPRDAAQWFLLNYNESKTGDRAPDSVVFLAESMKRLGDTKRACVALSLFASDFPREAAGRLKTQYDGTRSGLKCD